jgi:adenylosuccinate synthase
MPATIVVGAQYGSEGKGKVVALLASREESPWLVRCGGPNSGHTVTIGDTDVVLRQVPSCGIPNRATYCVGAGAVIDEDVLLHELDLLAVDRARILVDPRAAIVTEQDRQTEQRTLGPIASTLSGTGAALMRRMLRQDRTPLAEDSLAVRQRCRVETVAPLLHQALDNGEHVIVEGTQGFGLSLLHGTQYPFVTSRDTTASGFAMEVGLSPRDVNKIVMVVRTFPIRVGGASGPLINEISWDDIRIASGAPETIPEYTSVTKRLRRVARFDIDVVRLASRYNRPTSLAVMGVDRLDFANSGLREPTRLTPKAQQFLSSLEHATGVPIEFVGTGFSTSEVIEVSVDALRPVVANG